eukprot:ANDGO_01929.mRNA.1 hypothetical protein NAEGRDRAFT_81290
MGNTSAREIIHEISSISTSSPASSRIRESGLDLQSQPVDAALLNSYISVPPVQMLAACSSLKDQVLIESYVSPPICRIHYVDAAMAATDISHLHRLHHPNIVSTKDPKAVPRSATVDGVQKPSSSYDLLQTASVLQFCSTRQTLIVLPDDEKLRGIHDLAAGFSFLHTQCNLTHQKFSVDCAFVRSVGFRNWCLGMFCAASKASPESLRKDCTDFAVFVVESLCGITQKQFLALSLLQLQACSSVIKLFSEDLVLLLQQILASPDTVAVSRFMDAVRQCSCFSENPYVSFMKALPTIHIMTDAQKVSLFQDLASSFRMIPVSLRESNVLAALFTPSVLSEPACSHILRTVFSKDTFLPEDRFSEALLPLLEDAVLSRNRNVRARVLQSLDIILPLLAPPLLRDAIVLWSDNISDSDPDLVRIAVPAWVSVAEWMTAKSSDHAFSECFSAVSSATFRALHHVSVASTSVEERCQALRTLILATGLCVRSDAPVNSKILLSALEHNFFVQRAVRVTMFCLDVLMEVTSPSFSLPSGSVPGSLFTAHYLACFLIPLVSALIVCPHDRISQRASESLRQMHDTVLSGRQLHATNHTYDPSPPDVGADFPDSSNCPLERSSGDMFGFLSKGAMQSSRPSVSSASAATPEIAVHAVDVQNSSRNNVASSKTPAHHRDDGTVKEEQGLPSVRKSLQTFLQSDSPDFSSSAAVSRYLSRPEAATAAGRESSDVSKQATRGSPAPPVAVSVQEDGGGDDDDDWDDWNAGHSKPITFPQHTTKTTTTATVSEKVREQWNPTVSEEDEVQRLRKLAPKKKQEDDFFAMVGLGTGSAQSQKGLRHSPVAKGDASNFNPPPTNETHHPTIASHDSATDAEADDSAWNDEILDL